MGGDLGQAVEIAHLTPPRQFPREPTAHCRLFSNWNRSGLLSQETDVGRGQGKRKVAGWG